MVVFRVDNLIRFFCTDNLLVNATLLPHFGHLSSSVLCELEDVLCFVRSVKLHIEQSFDGPGHLYLLENALMLFFVVLLNFEHFMSNFSSSSISISIN